MPSHGRRLLTDPVLHFVLALLVLAPLPALVGDAVGGRRARLLGWAAAQAILAVTGLRAAWDRWHRVPRPLSLLDRKLLVVTGTVGLLTALGSLALCVAAWATS